jgi:hypothetical protein
MNPSTETSLGAVQVAPAAPAPVDRFFGLPILTAYIDGGISRLERNVAYLVKTGRLADHLATVRAGFVFNWASTPRLLWISMPPQGFAGHPYGIAALFHDWLYVHHAIASIPITRAEADALFLEIMLATGCGPIRSRIMWLGVRAGGFFAWHTGTPPPPADFPLTTPKFTTQPRIAT